MNVELGSLYMAISSRTVLCSSPEISTDDVMNIELWAGALIILKENVLKFLQFITLHVKAKSFQG